MLLSPRLRGMIMSKHEKPLPSIPESDDRQRPQTFPHKQVSPQTSAKSYITLKQQNQELYQHIQRIERLLQGKDKTITHLQQQLLRYQEYVQRQDQSFAQVTKAVCSAFEEFRQRTTPDQRERSDVSVTGEIIDVYLESSFSDSDGEMS